MHLYLLLTSTHAEDIMLHWPVILFCRQFQLERKSLETILSLDHQGSQQSTAYFRNRRERLSLSGRACRAYLGILPGMVDYGPLPNRYTWVQPS